MLELLSSVTLIDAAQVVVLFYVVVAGKLFVIDAVVRVIFGDVVANRKQRQPQAKTSEN